MAENKVIIKIFKKSLANRTPSFVIEWMKNITKKEDGNKSAALMIDETLLFRNLVSEGKRNKKNEENYVW